MGHRREQNVLGCPVISIANLGPPSSGEATDFNDPSWLTGEQRLLVIKILQLNFGPGHEKRDIKLDTLVRDEML